MDKMSRFVVAAVVTTLLPLCIDTAAGCGQTNLSCEEIRNEFFHYPFSAGKNDYEIKTNETVIARHNEPKLHSEYVEDVTENELIMKKCVDVKGTVFYKDDNNKAKENCTDFRVSVSNKSEGGHAKGKNETLLSNGEWIVVASGAGITIAVITIAVILLLVLVLLACRRVWSIGNSTTANTPDNSEKKGCPTNSFRKFMKWMECKKCSGGQKDTKDIELGIIRTGTIPDEGTMDEGSNSGRRMKDPGGQEDTKGEDIELNPGRSPDTGEQAAALIDDQASDEEHQV